MLHNKFLVSDRFAHFMVAWYDSSGTNHAISPNYISANTVSQHSTLLTRWVFLMQSHLQNGQCVQGKKQHSGLA